MVGVAPPLPLRRNHAFTLFLVGQTVSFTGSAMASIALPLLVLQATGSVAQMGLVTALLAVGSLLAGVVSGVLIDCLDVRRFMLSCEAGSALLYGAIPLYWTFGGAQVALLYLVAVPLGFLAIASSVAASASLPRLVGRDQLTIANSRFQIGYSLAYLGGPLLAGALLGFIGAPAILGLNALSYVVSVFTLLLIRLNPTEEALPPELAGWWGELLAGVRWLAWDARLRWTMLLRLFALSVMGGAFDLVVFRLKHELQQPDAVVGFAWGISALGALGAGLLTPLLRRRLGFGFSFLGGLALQGGSVVLVGLTGSVIPLLVLGVSLAFGDIVAQIVAAALLQELTPNRLQGRATAAVQTLLWVGTALGAAAETSLAAQLSATPPVFLLMGLLLLALPALGLLTPARGRVPEQQEVLKP